MRWRRGTGRPAATKATDAGARFELPATMPEEFEFDVSPAVRAAAARVRVTMDRKRGRVTPQWVLDLAEGRVPR